MSAGFRTRVRCEQRWRAGVAEGEHLWWLIFSGLSHPIAQRKDHNIWKHVKVRSGSGSGGFACTPRGCVPEGLLFACVVPGTHM